MNQGQNGLMRRCQRIQPLERQRFYEVCVLRPSITFKERRPRWSSYPLSAATHRTSAASSARPTGSTFSCHERSTAATSLEMRILTATCQCGTRSSSCSKTREISAPVWNFSVHVILIHLFASHNRTTLCSLPLTLAVLYPAIAAWTVAMLVMAPVTQSWFIRV